MTNYLIDFKNDVTDAQIETYLQENQCTILKTFDKLNKVYHVASNISPPVTSIVELVQNDDESTINLLEIKPLYQYPTIEKTVTVNHADDANWWKLYSYKEIDLSNDTTPVPIFGAGANIYLVDSGIDMSHPEFTGTDITLLHSIVPNDFNDYKGHGTALASVMIGNTCGISNASLKVVKIFNDAQTPIKQSDILYAFDAILNDVVLSKNIFSIVNLSWTIPKNEYIESKIQYMIDAGLVVVAAAGNSGLPIEQVTPASMPEVITVGAYQEDFTPCDFSNYTDPTITSLTNNIVNTGALDIWAPGDKIYAAKISSKGGGYGFTVGTSVAAAIESASLAFNLAQEIYNNSYTDTIDLSATGRLDIRYLIKYGRSGLLDLSNPKYVNSTNGICSFQYLETQEKNNAHYTNKNYDVFKKEKVRFAELVDHKQFFSIGNPLFNRYELTSALPDWITIVGHWIVLTPKAEPASGAASLEKYKISITLYPEDTTIDPIEHTISVLLVGSAYDVETQAPLETDPELQVILQYYFCRVGCCFDTNYGSCTPVYGCFYPSSCYPVYGGKGGAFSTCECYY